MSKNHKALRGWERARREALKLAGYRCSACGKAGRLEVHHIIDLDRGGAALAQENLTAMCRSCHIDIHKNNPANRVEGQAEWLAYLKGLQHAEIG